MLVMLLAQAMMPPIAYPPPPVIASIRTDRADRAGQPRMRVGITLRGGAKLLWEGSLIVAPRSMSSWRQSVQQPSSTSCNDRMSDARQDEISVQLLPAYTAGDGAPLDRMAVTVRWSRPAEDECGSRMVELRETVSLDPRTPSVLRGDGGLVVELRRQ